MHSARTAFLWNRSAAIFNSTEDNRPLMQEDFRYKLVLKRIMN
jgi:hypothetical protein